MRTNRVCAGLLLLLAAIASQSCSEPADPLPPFKPVAGVRQLMASVTDPATDIIWASVGTIITAQGTEERAPKTEEDWAAIRGAAMIVTESGNLLMMPGRAKDADEWITLSSALVDVGTRTLKIIDARDIDGLFTVGGDIYAVCVNCHLKYIDQIREEAAAPR